MVTFVVGIDPTTRSGLVALSGDGEVVSVAECELGNIRRGLGIDSRCHIFAERPFVGDNRRGAISHALVAGAVVERVAGWYGVEWPFIRWLEPSQWRREIGCPLSKGAAKDWCWLEADKSSPGSFTTPRGRKMYDAAEAWGIAQAGLAILKRGPNVGGESE